MREGRAPSQGLPGSPYVGLTYYQEEDAPFFFGREAERKIAAANLAAAKVTVLYAESGVGKSSLLRAGVIHHLSEIARRNVEERDGPGFLPVIFSTWGDEPARGLTRAIRDAAAAFPSGNEIADAGLEETIRQVNDVLGARALVVLDQFEEYFLYADADPDDQFVDEFVRAVNATDLRVGFLISLREDALSRLDVFQGRIPALTNQIRIEHLDVDAARAAIVKPLEEVNRRLDEAGEARRVDIEPELVDEILRQVALGTISAAGSAGDGEQPDVAHGAVDETRVETSYLQLVLERLWSEESTLGSTTLRLETLEKLGGAQRIVDTHLDETMSTLSTEEQEAAASVFRQLVTASGSKIALTVGDLEDMARLPRQRFEPVLRRLSGADARILRGVAPAPGRLDGYRYEIAHDKLADSITAWRRRHEEELRVREAAEAEREHARKLEEAERAAREAEERARQEHRRARILRLLLAACFVALALAVSAVAFAYVQFSEARGLAARNGAVAGAFRATEISAARPRTALRAALAAYALRDTFDTRIGVTRMLHASPTLPTYLEGHSRAVHAVTFSPDSRLVATGGFDGSLRLWDAATGGSRGEPTLGQDIVREVAFSPDGRALASIGDLSADALDEFNLEEASDGVRLLDVSDPDNVRALRTGHFDGREGTALAYGDGVLVAGLDDGSIRTWDVRDVMEPRRVDNDVAAHDRAVRGLAFARDDPTLLASAGDDGAVRLWRVTRVPELGLTPLGRPLITEGPVLDVAVGGGRLAAAKEGGRIRLWDVSVPRAPRGPTELFGHLDDVRALDISGNGELLVSAGADGTVLTWDVASRRPVGSPRTHQDWVNDVALSPDGRLVASASDDQSARIWGVRSSGLATILDAEAKVDDNDTNGFATLGDGTIAVARPSGIQIVDPSTPGRDPVPVPGIDGEAYDIASAGDLLAVVTRTKVLLGRIVAGRWEREGELPEHASVDIQKVLRIDLSSDGDLLVAGELDGTVSLWDVSRRARPGFVEAAESHDDVKAVAFGPSADHIASAGQDGDVQLYDGQLERLDRLEDVNDLGGTFALAFSPDGRLLAAGGTDQQVELFQIDDSGKLRAAGRPFAAQSQSILALAFSPDGRVLAAGDGDGDVVIWDVVRRQTLGEGLATHCPWANCGPGDDAIDALAFDPGGSYLVSGGRAMPIVVWESDLWSDDRDTLLAIGCGMVGEGLPEAEWREIFRETPFEDEWRETCPTSGNG